MNKQQENDSLIPLSCCDLGISYRCNYKCRMCKFWQNSPLCEENILSIDQWKNVLSEIADLPKQDGFMVNFSGAGEVFLRKGIFDLIEHAKDLGIRLSMITNGSVMDKEIAERFNNAGPETLAFSLDGLNPKTHDYLRGIDGAKEKVLKAIELVALCSPKTKLGINTVISKVNLKEVVELAKWVEHHKNISYINFQAITQPFSFTEGPKEDWFNLKENRFLWPEDKDTVNQTIDALIAIKLNENRITSSVEQLNIFREYFLDPLQFIKNGRCNLGKGNVLIIDSVGNVSMCSMVGEIGNIKDGKPIKAIINSPELKMHIEKINECKRNCHLVVSCYYQEESLLDS